MADLITIERRSDGKWLATYAGQSRGPFVERPSKVDAYDAVSAVPPVGVTPQGNLKAELWEADGQRFTAIERYSLSVAGPPTIIARDLRDGEHLRV